MIILGIDPGFASLGWSMVAVRPAVEDVLDCGVFETEKSAKKRAVRAADDNLRRAREISQHLNGLIEARVILGDRAFVVAAESMSFPRNASVAAKVAMCWGVVAAVADARRMAVVQASPQEVKRALCGRKDASKDDVAAAVCTRYPEVAKLAARIRKSAREHAFDSIAAVVACLDSEIVRFGRSQP